MLEHVDRVQIAVSDRAAAGADLHRRLRRGDGEGRRGAALAAHAAASCTPARASSSCSSRPATGRCSVPGRTGARACSRPASRRTTFAVLASRLVIEGRAVRRRGRPALHRAGPDAGPAHGDLDRRRRAPMVGLMRYLYEVDEPDRRPRRRRAASTPTAFGLDASRFSPIVSKAYGYTGQLTMFNPPERLDRIELSQITDWERPMGRFMKRRGGETLYMCYIEAEEIEADRRAPRSSATCASPAATRTARTRDGHLLPPVDAARRAHGRAAARTSRG